LVLIAFSSCGPPGLDDARELIAEHEFEAAEPILLDLVRKEGEAVEAAWVLADLLRRQGRFLEAEVYYEGLLKKRPDDPNLLRDLGDLYSDWGRSERSEDLLEKAKVQYERALSLFPEEPGLMARLAVVEAHLANEGRAEELFQEALSKQAPARDFCEIYVAFLYSRGRIEECRAFLERALLMLPDVPGLLKWKALLLWDQDGALQRAIECLRRSLKSDPRDYEAWLMLAWLHARSGSWADSRKVLGEACERVPGAAELWAASAFVELRMGNWAQAEKYLREALERGFRMSRELERGLLVSLALSQGDYDRAYQEAVLLAREDAHADWVPAAIRVASWMGIDELISEVSRSWQQAVFPGAFYWEDLRDLPGPWSDARIR